MTTDDPAKLKGATPKTSCKVFSLLYLVYISIQIWGKLQHANGLLSLGYFATINIPMYSFKVSPALVSSTWAICSVCDAVPSGGVLCCAV